MARSDRYVAARSRRHQLQSADQDADAKGNTVASVAAASRLGGCGFFSSGPRMVHRKNPDRSRRAARFPAGLALTFRAVFRRVFEIGHLGQRSAAPPDDLAATDGSGRVNGSSKVAIAAAPCARGPGAETSVCPLTR